MLLKELVTKIIKKLVTRYMIATYIILLILFLFMIHPLLRTVESQTMMYTIWDIDTNDESLILASAENAFALWEKSNPKLIFEKGDGGMTVVFLDNLYVKDGLAVCPFWSNSEYGCFIFVSLDKLDRYHYPTNKKWLTNVLTHEIGHVLGMMHSDKIDHLMYGPVYGWTFDDRGFNVPKIFESDVE